MNQKIHLWVEDTFKTDGSIVLGSTLEKSDGSRKSLWFRVPMEYSDVIEISHDPFVLGSLFYAMRSSSDLLIHGIVSPSLLRNLDEFQSVWNSWLPDYYEHVDISAEIEREYKNPNRQNLAISAFSGGIDSCFTLWRHRKGTCGRQQRDIKAGLMIHGLDIPLAMTEEFYLAMERSRKILSSIDVELIPMATNFRELDDEWEHAHGAAVASCLTLFKKRYTEGLIASSPPYSKLNIMLAWGSNPLTDGLMSSDNFRIIHDGAAFARHEKIYHLADWHEALNNFRVCWEGKRKDRNCGHCEKCIRTILSFRAAKIELPACFDQDIGDLQILGMRNLSERKIFDYKQILSFAKKNGCQETWMSALEKCIIANSKEPKKRFLSSKLKVTLKTAVKKILG